MELSKHKSRKFRKVKLDLRAKLEIATVTLLDDIYDTNKQGEIMEITNALEGVLKLEKLEGLLLDT